MHTTNDRGFYGMPGVVAAHDDGRHPLFLGLRLITGEPLPRGAHVH